MIYCIANYFFHDYRFNDLWTLNSTIFLIVIQFNQRNLRLNKASITIKKYWYLISANL